MERAIGLFDSGVGGLTVLNTIQALLPNENIIYVGDNKNCPYGNKTKEQLFQYASRIIEYFISCDVKLVVLACNTTSANVLEELQLNYPNIKLIGVIDATCKDAIEKQVQKPLVIATQATISSNKYAILLKELDNQVDVQSLATPLLVPLVESGMYKEGIYETLHSYLDVYSKEIDGIILGCTHYPILKQQIKVVLPNITIVSSSEAIGKQIHHYLTTHQMLNTDSRKYVSIYTTGDTEEFVYSSSGFFDYTGLQVKYLNLGD